MTTQHERLSVYVWAENCALAGLLVADRYLEEYDGDPADCADWVQYEGTAVELAEEALDLDYPAHCFPSRYQARTAQTLREIAYTWAGVHGVCLDPDCCEQPERGHLLRVCRDCGRCELHCACGEENDDS